MNDFLFTGSQLCVICILLIIWTATVGLYVSFTYRQLHNVVNFVQSNAPLFVVLCGIMW